MNSLRGPGATFAGFHIVRQLGAGGMGEVYLVEHPRLPRREALKVLAASFSGDEEYRQRFQREAELAAKLWHPNLVSLHDRGEAEGRLWISMDYIDGPNTAELVRTKYRAGMPVADVAEIVSALASALDYAHQSGMVHRDVKPANILCSRPDAGEQRVALADFGIAREINDSMGITATNLTLGTLAYAAPEQLIGAPIDGRADQYALAATAFHLLTGSPPFQNSNPAAVISQQLTAPPPMLSDYRPDLSALDMVFAKALSKEPAQRYPDCSAFARGFEQQPPGASTGSDDAPRAALPGSPVSAAAMTQRAGTPVVLPSSPSLAPPRDRRGLRPSRWRRRTPWVAGVAIAGVLIAGGIWAVPRLASNHQHGGHQAIGDPSTSSSGIRHSVPLPEGATTPQGKSKTVESRPFNASGLLAGTADPNLPDGEPGKVSVVQVGPLAEASIGSATLPIAFRNNTNEGISHVDWTGTARSGESIVATGSSQGTIPAQVQPGEVGLAFIYFDGSSKLPPTDAEYEFTVNTSVADQSSYNTAPIKVTEANLSDDAIVGAALNGTGESVAGPFSVSAYCFEGDKLLSEHGAFAEQDGPIAPGGTVTFSASLYGAACPTFVVGVSGWFQ